MNKKSIYYLLSNTPRILPISGDSITEIGIIKALSVNYDVYYNDKLFKGDVPGYGLTNTNIVLPSKKYDLYIVRNNPEIFKQLPGPKIYFAAPYDKRCFDEATAIYTFTDSWTEKLINGYAFPYNLYPSGYENKKAITINQVIDEPFFKIKNEHKINAIRSKIGGSFIIGHFGRVTDSCYPHSFLSIYPNIKKNFPNTIAVFFGSSNGVKKFSKTHKIKNISFSYDEVHHAVSACDLILYNYRDGQGHIAGSMKVLEAMACGVPVLSPRYDARVIEFGSNYPLFYPYENICETNAAPTKDRFSEKIEEIMYKNIVKCISNTTWKNSIGSNIKKRAEFYSINSSAKRFKKIIDEFVV